MARRTQRWRALGAVVATALVAGAVSVGAGLTPAGAAAATATAPFDLATAIAHLPKVSSAVTDGFSEDALYRRAIVLSTVGRTTETVQQSINADEQKIDADAVTATHDERAAAAAQDTAATTEKAARASGRRYAGLKSTLQQAALRLYTDGGSVEASAPTEGSADEQMYAQDYLQTAVGAQAALDARSAALDSQRADTAAGVAAASEARAEAAHAKVLLAGERAAAGRLQTELVATYKGNAGAVAADHKALVAQEATELTSPAALQFTPSKPLPAPLSTTDVALTWAFGELGKPYLWGGTGPGSFDCSGLTQYVWNKAGVSIPRVAAAQDAWSDPVPLSQLLPGDLVFYGTSDIHHVGMYIGDGLMINAPHTGTVVQVSPIWWSDLAGFGRVHADGTPTATHSLPSVSRPAPKVVNVATPVPSETKPPKKTPASAKKHPTKARPATTTTTVPSTTTTTTPPSTSPSTTTTTTVPPTTVPPATTTTTTGGLPGGA